MLSSPIKHLFGPPTCHYGLVPDARCRAFAKVQFVWQAPLGLNVGEGTHRSSDEGLSG